MSSLAFFVFSICLMKEKSLEKVSTNLEPEENSLLSESNAEEIPLR